MEFYQVGNSGVRLSRIALGGHEYLPNGNSRGFNEDFQKAITPGYIFPGFGGEKRKALVKAAYDAGVNFFDVTHDSEKEALGRNLTEMPPPYPVYVQTRGELMNYSYDPGNQKMTDLGLLRAEVQRILKLMRRERRAAQPRHSAWRARRSGFYREDRHRGRRFRRRADPASLPPIRFQGRRLTRP